MQLEFIWCGECGKVIPDEEYVVNWGSCNQCFDAGVYLYFAVNSEQLELFNEDQDWQT